MQTFTKLLIFSSTFLSAFLLFFVQPMFSKYLLPFFGGTSSVWTISIFFFSTALLIGYVYAAVLLKWKPKVAFLTHSALILVVGSLFAYRHVSDSSALFIDPVLVASPAAGVLLTLIAAVGFVVVVLASNSVLMHKLYEHSVQEEPYKLYAISNFGSFAGLLAYPLLFEYMFGLSDQALLWEVTLGLFVLVLLSAWMLAFRGSGSDWKHVDIPETVALKRPLWLLGIAAVPTFLLAVTTEYVSKGIASFPLLWVIPLALYLLSFIVAFSDTHRLKHPKLVTWVSLPSLLLLLIFIAVDSLFWLELGITLLAFFFVCVHFHAKLFDNRPKTTDLGKFYIWITFGGAIGSGVVAFILPLVLNVNYDFKIAIFALFIYFVLSQWHQLPKIIDSTLSRLLKFYVVFCVCFFMVYTFLDDDQVASKRNFYGTNTVVDDLLNAENESTGVRVIKNGSIIHGFQSKVTEFQHLPIGYYGQGSGIQTTIEYFNEKGEPPRLAVVGLGAGVLSGYCDQLESLTFVEINPQVLEIAEEYFTYLEYCNEKVVNIIGDGRLELEKLVEDRVVFDIIEMDAFTDDAIPTHLLTKEAFEDSYIPLLSEDGFLVFHISNIFLDLAPNIVGTARELGLDAVLIQNKPEGELEDLHTKTSWVVVGAKQTIESYAERYSLKPYSGESYVWTDDRHSVLQAFSLKGSLTSN